MQLKEVTQTDPMYLHPVSPHGKILQNYSSVHNQDITTDARTAQNSSSSREQTWAHSCAVGVPRCLCRHWTHMSPHGEPHTGPGAGGAVKPQRGRALAGRSQATFSASCLKCKTASDSSSQCGMQSPLWVSFWPSNCFSSASIHILPRRPTAIPSRPPGPGSLMVQAQGQESPAP